MYQTFLRALLALPLFIASLSAEECTQCDHKPRQTNNSLSPITRLVVAPSMLTEDIGVSLLGEVGTKNYRIGGTLAGSADFLPEGSQLKVSGEYLSQKLAYGFYSGKLHRWVNQYAVGGEYRYMMPACGGLSSWINSLDVNITYAEACSRHVKATDCPVNPLTNQIPTLFRNVAGGQNAHIDIGTTLTPWCNAQFFVGVDYDYTYYKRKYQNNLRSSGFGGSLWLNQILPNNFNLDLGIEFRRPFNYYSAAMKWNTPFSCGNLSLGIFASYTNGRNKLPNSSVAGVSIDFSFGGGPLFPSETPFSNYAFDDFGMPMLYTSCCECPCDSQLLAWIAKPAVYMPTVLAIADQTFTYRTAPPLCPTCPICPICPPPCSPLSSTLFTNGQGPITSDNPFVADTGGGSTYPAGQFITGTNLIFTISPTGQGVSIDQNTGLVTVSQGSRNVTPFTITATNSCCSVQQILWIRQNPS